METSDQDRIRAEVRSAYGAVARGGAEGCCGPAPVAVDSQRLGYSPEELSAVPEGADLGLGCGNPTGLADLKPGETVLDLGSGAGFDCFLAARQVGPTGRVVGVDMTAEMIAKARANAVKAGLDNVEFRLGEIEALPVADGSVDAILSNCVVNLSPDKERVFREAFRVLRPGGRLAVSDMVATEDLPEEVKADLHLYSCCIGGASPIAEIESALAAAGFAEIRIVPKDGSRELVREWAPGRGVEDLVVSASIQAIKPQSSPRHQPSPSPMNPETDRAPPLHASIVALVALAANIAANHPKQGLCQVERLKDLGVPESQIRAAVEIARHIRDEAPGLLDRQFDEKVESLLGATPKNPAAPAKPQSVEPKLAAGTALPVAAAPCCTPTKSGQSCC